MSNHSLQGFHHFYLGLVIQAVGFVSLWHINWPPWGGFAIIVIGLIICIDDAIQHTIGRHWDPNFTSWLHRLYAKIWHWQWIQKLNKFFDWLFYRFGAYADLLELILLIAAVGLGILIVFLIVLSFAMAPL